MCDKLPEKDSRKSVARKFAIAYKMYTSDKEKSHDSLGNQNQSVFCVFKRYYKMVSTADKRSLFVDLLKRLQYLTSVTCKQFMCKLHNRGFVLFRQQTSF